MERMFRFLSLNAVDGIELSWALRPGGMSTLTGSSLTLLLSRLVDPLGVVVTISRDGRYRTVDLFEQHGYPSRVTRSTRCQIRGNDLARGRVDCEVQFAPSPVLWRFLRMAEVFTSMARFEYCATILVRRPICDTLTSSI